MLSIRLEKLQREGPLKQNRNNNQSKAPKQTRPRGPSRRKLQVEDSTEARGSPLLTAAEDRCTRKRPPAINKDKHPKTKTTKTNQNPKPTPNKKDGRAGTTGTHILLWKRRAVGTVAAAGALSPRRGRPDCGKEARAKRPEQTGKHPTQQTSPSKPNPNHHTTTEPRPLASI